MMTPSPESNDLLGTRDRLRQGQTSVVAELEQCLENMGQARCELAFLRSMAEDARERVRGTELANLPLAGLAISSKDLFDVAGQPTLAGSRVLAGRDPAAADAPALARLREAGGVLVGRTNMTEFAFSAIGVNPHYGTPAAWDGLYGQAIRCRNDGEPSIPGGSSSGGAVSVATGAAFVGLGSDTGGSIRIPAALNGIVGFKSTARLVPTAGAIPLSSTLDTVCAMTRSVRDAILVHELLAARTVLPVAKPLSQLKLAVVRNVFLDALDATVAGAFERSLKGISSGGASVKEIALDELAALQDLQAMGGFTAAESFAWHRELLQSTTLGGDGPQYDPRVRFRIERGAGIKAWEYIDLVQARQRWIAGISLALRDFDAVLSPTLPMVGSSLAAMAPGAERDDAFFRANTLLLRNTSIVNMFDGCAISVPCHRADEMPVGLMLWHGAGHDDAVLSLALHIEQSLRPVLRA